MLLRIPAKRNGVASFPGFPSVQFLIPSNMQRTEGKDVVHFIT